jgi:hypothetical protein
MITEKEIEDIYNALIDDESFCRLLYYGEDPFEENKPDIKTNEKYKEIMESIIWLSPQRDDLEKNERVRMCLYKHYSKINIANSPVRYETIQFEIYVPHRLMKKDKRIYQLENKIVNLIDHFKIGTGNLDYVNGNFVTITNVTGYSQYSMSFLVAEGRRMGYGKL